jgi:hypothetical protein
MYNKYFTVTKKISIAASIQHAGAWSAGKILSDWVPIQIPKGSSCLKSVTMLVRPKGDATPTQNIFGAELLFSTTNTTSLGTVRVAPTHIPFPDVIGLVEITTGNFATNVYNSTAIASTGMQGNDNEGGVPLILTGDVTTGDNVGFDTIYMGVVATGNFTFESTTSTVNESNFGAGTQTEITMDGNDATRHFAAGDVLHAQDDAVLGTVSSVTSNTITLTAANTDAIEDDDVIYNLHPITIILGFEK